MYSSPRAKAGGERGEVPIVRHPHAPPGHSHVQCRPSDSDNYNLHPHNHMGGADDEAFGRWAAQITYHIPTHC